MSRTEMPPVSDNCNTKLTLKSPSSHFEQHKNTQCVHRKEHFHSFAEVLESYMYPNTWTRLPCLRVYITCLTEAIKKSASEYQIYQIYQSIHDSA